MEEEQKQQKSVVREIFAWLLTIFIAVFAAVLINNFLIINAQIPSESMESTIMTGDRIIGFRLSYAFGKQPQRGDIVIFKYPDNEKELYIKRIIGMPGESVKITDGKVYINGNPEPLEEDYLKNGTKDQRSFGAYEVPEGAYFVMGDNRTNSSDSRMWNNTYVYEEKILGRASFRLFPKPGKIG